MVKKSLQVLFIKPFPGICIIAVLNIIFFALLFINYSDAKKASEYSHSNQFDRNVWITENLIDNQFYTVKNDIASVKRFFESSEHVTRYEFKNFVKVKIEENPNIICAGWVPEVDRLKLPLLKKMAIEEGIRDFKFSEINEVGEKRYLSDRDKYYPLYYIEGSAQKNEETGFDLSTQTIHASLIKKALITGATVTATISDNENKKSKPDSLKAILYTPVYKNSSIHTENKIFSGLLYFVLDIDEMIRPARIHTEQEGLSLSLRENEAASKHLFYMMPTAADNSDLIIISGKKKISLQSQSHVHEISFADKTYIFTLFDTKEYTDSPIIRTRKIQLSLLAVWLTIVAFCIGKTFAQTDSQRETNFIRAAESLRTKSLIKSIIDSIPQNICWKDAELNYLGCNSSFAKAVGLSSSEEILMLKNTELPSLMKEQFNENREKKVIETGSADLHDIIEIADSFSSKWIDACRIPIISDDGNMSGILCIYEDITQAKNAEKELSVAKLLLETAFEQNYAGMILITTDDMRIKLANPAALKFFGMDKEPSDEYINKKITEIIFSWQEFDASGNRIDIARNSPLAKALNGIKTINEEFKIIKNDGETAWNISIGTPIYDKEGRIIAGLLVFTDITARKKMEDRFKISEEKYRALFEQSHIGVFLYNHDFIIIDCNEQFAKTIGAPIENLIGLELKKLKDQRVMPVLVKGIKGEKTSYEGDYDTTTSGLSIRVAFTALPIKNNSNEIIYGCAVVENITDRWRFQEALKIKSEELDKFFTNSLDLLCLAGTDSKFKRLNPQWEKTLGYRLDELTGRSFWDFVHPEDIEKTKKALSALESALSVVDFENRYRCKDGSYKWIEWRSFPSGEIIYAAARDITARKMAEEEIKNREELFRTLSEMAPIGIFLANEIGEVILTNKRWLEITGVSFEESLGDGWIKCIHPDDLKNVRRIWTNSIDIISDAQAECRILMPGGKIKNALAKVTPIIKEGKFLSGFVGIIEDVTERKKAETERERLLIELRQKNSELESIVYAASHDLRAPLVNIQGFSIRIDKLNNELSSIIKSGGDHEKCLNIIENKIPKATNYIKISTSKMDALIKGLLQVARLGRRPLFVEKIGMNSLIDTILSSMAFQIQAKDAEIILSNLPDCMGDCTQLNQAFSNIIDNALKYSIMDRKLTITISGYSAKGKSIYTIKDTGSGISKDQIDKIWNLFFRISPSDDSQGEGLGLTMVKKIIERHGGRTWVESGPEGTCFYIELPCA